MDVLLLRVVMPFWDAMINGFVFPFGIISPTIYDLLVMFGLPDGCPEFYDNPVVTNSGTHFEFSSVNLTTYIQSNKILRVVIEAEHNAFLLA